ILDFGLARQDTPSAASGTLAPTINLPTEPGAVLGTVGYMAPEQVRGAPVDSRADLVAFGALLFEMVTGCRAFQRGAAAETMTAILREDPPEAAMSGLPLGIERVVRRCLEKKPEARFRSAHDLAFALESLTGASSGSSAAAIPHAPVVDRSKPWAAALAAIIAIALAAGTGVWYGRRSFGSAGAFQPPRFRPLTFDDVTIDAARLAPDGQTVVYQARQGLGDVGLQMTRLEFPGATTLAIPSAQLFGISPQAEILAGINLVRTGTLTETTLVRVPLLGGAPRAVLDHVTFA